jgi:hypothetical protein
MQNVEMLEELSAHAFSQPLDFSQFVRKCRGAPNTSYANCKKVGYCEKACTDSWNDFWQSGEDIGGAMLSHALRESVNDKVKGNKRMQ